LNFKPRSTCFATLMIFCQSIACPEKLGLKRCENRLAPSPKSPTSEGKVSR